MENKYQIINNKHLPTVISRVNIAISKWWKPLGGIAVANIKTDTQTGEFTDKGEPELFFIQAMVK